MAYVDEIFADSPAAYWRMHADTGAGYVPDEVGTPPAGTNPAAMFGAPSFTTNGAIAGNNAITLNGTNQYLQVFNNSALDVGNTFTLETWVKTSHTATTQYLFSK